MMHSVTIGASWCSKEHWAGKPDCTMQNLVVTGHQGWLCVLVMWAHAHVIVCMQHVIVCMQRAFVCNVCCVLPNGRHALTCVCHVPKVLTCDFGHVNT